FTDSSEALADMPERWLAALRGEGPVNLREANLLSDHQIMWTRPGLISRAAGFFGSKALRGRSRAIPNEQYPLALPPDHYRGKVFRIEEPVVDPVSTMRALSEGCRQETFLIDWESQANIECVDSHITAIEVREEDDQIVRVEAQHYLLAAGAGNGPFLQSLGLSQPKMQLRPLHQLILRHPDLPDFFSVCVGKGTKPPIVVTTHRDSSGRKVWYVGGNIAEKPGVERGEADQIEEGKRTFSELMPWIDLEQADWFTWRGDRAEAETGTGDRPPGAYCRKVGNLLIAWPTKLALAPELADQVLEKAGPGSDSGCHGGPEKLRLPHPGFGIPPWDLP
ncbi:MAG: FAD-dependent oxidoreductase, partial [Verrucomicrobiota bacterium]